MSIRVLLFSSAKCLAVLCALCVFRGLSAFGQLPATQPYPGVTVARETRAEPPLEVFAVRINLRAPNVSVSVAPGGPDPDGPQGKWETTLDQTGNIAERHGFEVAINGDFFAVEEVIDPETGKRRGYHVGQAALVIGKAMSGGRQWSDSPGGKEPRPCLVITADRRAMVDEGRKLPRNAREVIAGSHIVVKSGRNVAERESAFARTRHPRTAVGVANRGRTLVMVVVDGRRPDTSVGASLEELAEIMLELGCEDALNLDGGGSSTLVMRNPETGQLLTVNRPSDGRQRAVANVLGVDAGAFPPPAPATSPATSPADRPPR